MGMTPQEEVLAMCDLISLSAEKMRDIVIDGGTAMEFLQEALRMSGVAGMFAQAASSLIDMSAQEMEKALSRASSDLLKDLIRYMKEEDNG